MPSICKPLPLPPPLELTPLELKILFAKNVEVNVVSSSNLLKRANAAVIDLEEENGNSYKTKAKGTSSTTLKSSNEKSTYPWSAEVKKVLFHVFHLEKFRANQAAAIDATLSGQDVFVLMPTWRR